MKNKNTKIPQMVLALRSVLLYVLLLSTTPTLQAQSWQWANGGGSDDNLDSFAEEEVKSICTDIYGNVYVSAPVGLTNLYVAGVPKPTYASIGSNDNVIASFSCDGAYRWSKVIGGYRGSARIHLSSDAAGNVYAAGSIRPGTNINLVAPHFDTDIVLPVSNSSTNTYKKNIYLIKYNAAGEVQWLRMPQPDDVSYSNSLSNYATFGMQVDALGTSYWLCRLPVGLIANGAYTVTTAGFHILKYDANGTFVSGFPLALQQSGSFDVKMRLNKNTGTIYFTGEVNQTEPGISLIINGEPVTHSKYVAAFSNTGAFLWKRENANVNLYGAGGIAFGVNSDINNNVYFTGATGGYDTFNGTPFTNEATTLPFLVKFDANGNTLWQTNGGKSSPREVVVNGNEVAITGKANGMTWQNLTSQLDINTSGMPYLARFNTATGTIIAINELTVDSGSSGTALATDSKGNYYLGGLFSSTLTAGTTTVTNIGGSSDFFVAKFGTTDCNFLATEQPEEQKLKMYPNPVKDYLHLENITNSTYVLYDVLGTVVAKGVVSENSALNFSQLSSGLYVLEVVKNTGEKTVVKVLKE